MTDTSSQEVTFDGHSLKLSNLNKVLYPETGFTKAGVIDYYRRIAPVLLTHLGDRPLTLHRFPNGVEQAGFYEKNCPSHRPAWVEVVDIEMSRKTIHQCVVKDTATIVWLANLASLEMHPLLSRVPDYDTPTKLTFDLDPGAPATIVECCQVALHLRELFDHFEMQAFPKTSGSKGMQVDVPLNTKVTFDETKQFAHAVAQRLEAQLPKLVVSEMAKAQRTHKVFVDWSQNDRSKTTITAYSLRARPRQWVSTPLTWDEVDEASQAKSDPCVLRFETDDVLERVDALGDLAAEVQSLKQKLPSLAS